MKNKRRFLGGKLLNELSCEKVYELGKLCFDLRNAGVLNKYIVLEVQKKYGVIKYDLNPNARFHNAEMSMAESQISKYIKNFKIMWFDKNYKK